MKRLQFENYLLTWADINPRRLATSPTLEEKDDYEDINQRAILVDLVLPGQTALALVRLQ